MNLVNLKPAATSGEFQRITFCFSFYKAEWYCNFQEKDCIYVSKCET